MRRAHRSLHLALWLILIPAIILAAWLVLSAPPAPLEQDSLPASLMTEEM